jgi:acetyl esterase/lipase
MDTGDGEMIKPQDYSFEEFPEAEDMVPGMKELAARTEENYYLCDANVPYITRDGLELHLQILKPENAEKRIAKLPCIVFVQGSAWMKQNTFVNLPGLAKLAGRGFIIASAEYRHSAVAPFPAQFLDVKTAIRFLRKHASLYGIDPENIFIFGDSSGGHTSLMVGITEGIEEFDTPDYREYSAHVNAVVDYYGPTDIAKMNDVPSTMDHMAPNSPEGMLIGGKCVPENVEQANKTSPIRYLSKDREIAPILIIHGNKDRLVPFHQSVLLYEALKDNGKEVEFYKLLGADHGGSPFWTNEVLDIVEGFIRKYIKEYMKG